MKQINDRVTAEIPGLKMPVGRPVTGRALTGAQRQAAYRARKRDLALVPMTVNIPVDLHARLSKFLEFKDTTKDEVVERFLRQALRKR